MRMISLIFSLQLIVAGCSALESKNLTERSQKALSVFTVVKFPNTVCVSSTSGRNGTCYTASECSALSGSSSGSCASSFGVCCVFEKSCGDGSIAQNCTYFTSSARTLGAACELTICKSNSDVCQLRLDFETFAMSNPVTATTITIGPTTAAAGTGNSLGQCQTDTFTVTNPGGNAPPVICGTNTGEHMYVDASDKCNVLNANFGSSSTATTSSFAIKVTQVECSSHRRAPPGCTQYYTGTSGSVSTFNYQSGSGVLLFNQNYEACIRSERTTCSICYYTSAFAMSVANGIAAIGALGWDTNCGVPGLTLANGGSYDYITLPSGQCDYPSTIATAVTTVNNDRYCGTSFNCAQTNAIKGTPANTICTNQRPFKIGVFSDDAEYAFPAALGEGSLANNRGFIINWYQKTECQRR